MTNNEEIIDLYNKLGITNNQTNGSLFEPILDDPKSHLCFYGSKLSDYINDGFVKVCKVLNSSNEQRWTYGEIDQTILYSDHKSWIYLIVVDEYVFKIGETSQPLGIRSKEQQIQPNTGTKSRIGRYINGDATDEDIRLNAQRYLDAGCKIEFWAKRCDIIKGTTTILGKITETQAATQKDQELLYFDNFIELVGFLPMWNKSRK